MTEKLKPPSEKNETKPITALNPSDDSDAEESDSSTQSRKTDMSEKGKPSSTEKETEQVQTSMPSNDSFVSTRSDVYKSSKIKEKKTSQSKRDAAKKKAGSSRPLKDDATGSGEENNEKIPKNTTWTWPFAFSLKVSRRRLDRFIVGMWGYMEGPMQRLAGYAIVCVLLVLVVLGLSRLVSYVLNAWVESTLAGMASLFTSPFNGVYTSVAWLASAASSSVYTLQSQACGTFVHQALPWCEEEETSDTLVNPKTLAELEAGFNDLNQATIHGKDVRESFSVSILKMDKMRAAVKFSELPLKDTFLEAYDKLDKLAPAAATDLTYFLTDASHATLRIRTQCQIFIRNLDHLETEWKSNFWPFRKKTTQEIASKRLYDYWLRFLGDAEHKVLGLQIQSTALASKFAEMRGQFTHINDFVEYNAREVDKQTAEKEGAILGSLRYKNELAEIRAHYQPLRQVEEYRDEAMSALQGINGAIEKIGSHFKSLKSLIDDQGAKMSHDYWIHRFNEMRGYAKSIIEILDQMEASNEFDSRPRSIEATAKVRGRDY